MNSLQIHYTCMARSAKVLSDTCQPRCKSLRRTSGVSQISVSIVSLPVSGACKGACIETMARNEKQKPGHSLCADVTSESCTGANQSPCSTTYVFVIPNTKRPNRHPRTHPVPCIRFTNFNGHTIKHNKRHSYSSLTGLITLYIHGNQPVTRNLLSVRKQPYTERERESESNTYTRGGTSLVFCLTAMNS